MKGLSLLQYYIKFSSNKLGWHHVNKVCEPFFAELFNIIFNLNLKILKGNFPGIDLADKSNEYSVQITSDGTKQKLKHTIYEFEKEKLFKKYSTLLHFVVGEKHFFPGKKDPYQFEKGVYNTYYADVTIGKHKYQIIIQDIYDLLLIINEKESDDLTRIHRYIDENINKFIEKVKQPLYSFEPGTVDKFTANTFITYCNVDISARKQFKKDLENLAEVLKGLPENTLRFLYYAMQANEGESNTSGIEVNVALLKGRLCLDNKQLQEEIDILRRSQLIDKTSLEYNEILILEYIDSEGNETMKDLYNFCQQHGRSLKDLILNVNFRQLN